MVHPQRLDADGRYFHVMNRGIARRTVFERSADVRYFLSRAAFAPLRPLGKAADLVGFAT